MLQGMFRRNCFVQVGSCKKHQKRSFLQIQTVPQRITALGPTQTPNRPIPTSLGTAKHHLYLQKKKRQIHGSKIVLMMPGMARPREPHPPQRPRRNADFGTDKYRVLDTQHTMPRKWQPQKPSALTRDSEGRPSCGLPSTRSTGVGRFVLKVVPNHATRAWMKTLPVACFQVAHRARMFLAGRFVRGFAQGKEDKRLMT